MKLIDATLRADAGEAKLVITDIFKASHPSAMRSYLTFLYASVKFLSSRHNDKWGITLFGDGVRLNAGWLGVLALRRDGLRVLVERESAPSGTRFRTATRIAPECSWINVPLSGLPTVLPTLSKAHLGAMSIATKRKTKKSIREAHSTGVIEYLSEFLHKKVPRPSYQLKADFGQDYLALWRL